MQAPSMTGPSGLDKFSKKCAAKLFNRVMYEFEYPEGCTLEHWPVEDIKNRNEKFLKSLRHAGNVYAIFISSIENHSSWDKVYVGERKSYGLRERITQHFIDKSIQTGSTLEAVKLAVNLGKRLGVSFIKVEPESLRLYVEETIILRHKNELPWNIHG